MVDRSQTIIQPLDLRRKVKLKPRKHYVYKEDNKRVRKGRTYADFIAYLAENPLIPPVQIDTVESVSTTIFFSRTDLSLTNGFYFGNLQTFSRITQECDFPFLECKNERKEKTRKNRSFTALVLLREFESRTP